MFKQVWGIFRWKTLKTVQMNHEHCRTPKFGSCSTKSMSSDNIGPLSKPWTLKVLLTKNCQLQPGLKPIVLRILKVVEVLFPPLFGAIPPTACPLPLLTRIPRLLKVLQALTWISTSRWLRSSGRNWRRFWLISMRSKSTPLSLSHALIFQNTCGMSC